jgi:hypothetical protein
LPGALHKGLSDYQFVIPQVLTKVFGDETWVPTGVKAVVGTVEPDRSVQAQRAYVTAFFDQFLQRKPQRLLREQSPDFPEVTFVR